MVYVKSIIFGAVAGLVGASAWAAIAYFSGYEVGWIAWGVGALVGIAVRWGWQPDVSPTGDTAEDALRAIRADTDQVGPGIVAAFIAILAVAVGKYLTVMLFVGNMSSALLEDEEFLISYVADEVVREHAEAGRAVSWPVGVDPANAVAQSDYPEGVWSEAVGRWQAMSLEEQEQFRVVTATMMGAMFVQNGLGALWATFGMMDLLWFGLASWTAFKMAASGSEE